MKKKTLTESGIQSGGIQLIAKAINKSPLK